MKERVREEIRIRIEHGRQNALGSIVIADEILSIPSLAILSDNQNLPDNRQKLIGYYATYNKAQQDMLNAGFKRVI